MTSNAVPNEDIASRFEITVPQVDGQSGRELPFVIGVIGDFGGRQASLPLSTRTFISTDNPGEAAIPGDGSTQRSAESHGLRYLLRKCAETPSVMVKTLHATKAELMEDMSTQLERSQLFSKVVDHALGSYGSEPLTILLADYEFSPQPQDIALMKAFAILGQRSFAPVLTSTTVDFLPASVAAVRDPSEACETHFKNLDFQEWRRFRSHRAAHSLFLVIPRLSITAPSAPSGEGNPADHDRGLNIANPIYFVAMCLALAHQRYGWSLTVYAEVNPEMILTAEIGHHDEATTPLRLPPLRWAEALSQFGFIPIVGRRGSDTAMLFSCRSASNTIRNRDQLLAAVLTARIIHAILVFIRERGQECNSLLATLQGWISKLCSPTVAPASTRYKSPLLAGAVTLEDSPGPHLKLTLVPNLSGHDTCSEKIPLRRAHAAGAGAEGGATFDV